MGLHIAHAEPREVSQNLPPRQLSVVQAAEGGIDFCRPLMHVCPNTRRAPPPGPGITRVRPLHTQVGLVPAGF